MKIETLKRSHKKEIIIGVIVVIAIVATITMTTSKAKYRTTQVLPLVEGVVNYTVPDLRIVSIKISEDGENYTDTEDVPTSGYTLNTSKSICRVFDGTTTPAEAPIDNNITLEYVDGKINVNNVSKKNTRCYLYFDKEKTGADTILANLGTSIKTTTPTFSQVATTDEGVFKTADGMYGGDTYYWRGATTTNHVIFANKCWRIVRINGDKTMRLIYNGDVQSGNTCTGNGANSSAVIFSDTTESKVPNLNRYATTGNDYNNSSHVGWTYSLESQRTLSGTSSNAKTQTEKWYSSNITGTNAEKVADGKFCNDRNVGQSLSTDSGYVTTWSAKGTQFRYAGVKRLHEDYNPTFSCNSGDTYTLKVGAVTADEVEFAGGKNAYNTSYYLYTDQPYWTMSPSYWDCFAYVFFVSSLGSLFGNNVHDTGVGLRPVINLRSDIAFKSGTDGTSSKPYVVQ